MTVAFTTGSCNLTTYRLTAAGLEWGNNQKEVEPNPASYKFEMFEKIKMALTDKIMGFFMVPSGNLWNYSFNGNNFTAQTKYTLEVGIPREFYNEVHRTQHFLDFTNQEEADEVEREDTFA